MYMQNKVMSLPAGSLLCGLLFLFLLACKREPVVESVAVFSHVNHPQIVYWAWDDHTITDEQYLRDIDKMVEKSPFTLAVLTSRFPDSVGFWDTQKMKPILKQTVEYAHRKGLKVALQIWPMNRTRELFLHNQPFAKKDAEILIAEGECILGADGKGTVVNKSTSARFNKVFDSELMQVWLFRKSGDGFYAPSSLVVAESDWVITRQNQDSSLQVAITAPKEYAGYTAYVTTADYYNYYDVFSTKHGEVFKTMLDAYSDIPFDGTALDENGAMGVTVPKTRPAGMIMPDRPWGKDFEAFYSREYKEDPVRLLLDMRYAPEGKPEVRIKAINSYMEARAKGTTQVENFFYEYSKKLFGQDCFVGCHTTFHNSLTGDDIWTTGLNWWDLPREYGQTDEGLPMPDRMGIALSGTQPIMYNMYYSRDKYAMYREAMASAPFGGREHYHGWNDSQGWGKNLQDDDFLEDLKPVEERIRLLNHFNPVSPRLPLLIVYNFPYLLNWYPDREQANAMAIRNSDMQATASAVWKAGYLCATIPSTWLEHSIVSIREDGKVQIKDRVFDAVLYLDPQYAKQNSLSFMKDLVEKKGRLMIRGNATLDFDGQDCSALFDLVMKQAKPFNLESMDKLGLSPNMIPNGTFLNDGSVVMADYKSIQENGSTDFDIKIGEHQFSGKYQGIFALKVDTKGRIEKLACGNFTSLKRDGETILEIESPADVILEDRNSVPTLLIKGDLNKLVVYER